VSIHPIDVIQHKRDGLALSDAEIEGFIRGLVEREGPTDAPTDSPAGLVCEALGFEYWQQGTYCFVLGPPH
jgi:hypothetical protein